LRNKTFLKLLLLAVLAASPLLLAVADGPALADLDAGAAVLPAENGADAGAALAELDLGTPEALQTSGCTAELTCPADGTVISCSGSWQCYRGNTSVVCDSQVTYCPGPFGGGPGGGGPIPQQ